MLRSLVRSAGPIPNAAVAIDGSTKYLVSLVLMAAFERKLGFHASMSSITNIFFRTSMYDETVSTSSESVSFAAMSDLIPAIVTWVPWWRARERISLLVRVGLRLIPSTRDMSMSVTAL